MKEKKKLKNKLIEELEEAQNVKDKKQSNIEKFQKALSDNTQFNTLEKVMLGLVSILKMQLTFLKRSDPGMNRTIIFRETSELENNFSFLNASHIILMIQRN